MIHPCVRGSIACFRDSAFSLRALVRSANAAGLGVDDGEEDEDDGRDDPSPPSSDDDALLQLAQQLMTYIESGVTLTKKQL